MKKAILIPLIVLISLVVIVGIACAVLYFNDFKVVLEVVGDEKVVDVNMRRLRMKIEDEPSLPKHLVTVWGMGYKWN